MLIFRWPIANLWPEVRRVTALVRTSKHFHRFRDHWIFDAFFPISSTNREEYSQLDFESEVLKHSDRMFSFY